MEIFGFDPDKAFDYENGFYLTSDVRRIAKLLAHYEIYRKITSLHGAIVECGVFKGASFVRFATFREVLESARSRPIIGFDIFGRFPDQPIEQDNAYAKKFEAHAGTGIEISDFEWFLKHKNLTNYELVRGDITQTVPNYAAEHPELRIALLHIDVDVYTPTMAILESLYNRIVPNGVLVLDDYGTVAGETRAVDEFFATRRVSIQKLSFSHIPAFIVKP